MPAVFPHAYALILFEGYAEGRESAVSRAPMETGPVKQLKTKSRVLVTRPVRILLRSNANYESFISWFTDDINLGADWFDFTDPRDNVVRSARIVEGKIDPKPTRKDLARWIVATNIETWSG